MFTWMWIFGIVLLVVAGRGPGELADRPRYTCDEFQLGARFDPIETIDSTWKIFYFWANTTEENPIVFSLPAKQKLDKFRAVMEPGLADQVVWSKAGLVMEPRLGVQVLLLHADKPGAFNAIVKKEVRDTVRPHLAPLIKFSDVRFKIVARYMGMMACEDLTFYALSRLKETPETEGDCEKAAAVLGLPLEGGRSYLYVANLTRRKQDEL